MSLIAIMGTQKPDKYGKKHNGRCSKEVKENRVERMIEWISLRFFHGKTAMMQSYCIQMQIASIVVGALQLALGQPETGSKVTNFECFSLWSLRSGLAIVLA